jgi:hypothetical protein
VIFRRRIETRHFIHTSVVEYAATIFRRRIETTT